tara:strand:+ start:287 stop:673 length:387 start_codon:yes stop_codon:yes gene_type:complete
VLKLSICQKCGQKFLSSRYEWSQSEEICFPCKSLLNYAYKNSKDKPQDSLVKYINDFANKIKINFDSISKSLRNKDNAEILLTWDLLIKSFGFIIATVLIIIGISMNFNKDSREPYFEINSELRFEKT